VLVLLEMQLAVKQMMIHHLQTTNKVQTAAMLLATIPKLEQQDILMI